MRFRDEIVIHVRGGRGGDGAVAFRRAKYEPRGGPDGGDGGRGGGVWLCVDENLNTLDGLAARPVYQAQDGAPGGPKSRTGRKGKDLTLRVPAGTVVFDLQTGARLADLDRPGEKVLVARGGSGGRGNRRFATPTRQTPRCAEKGEPGGERRLRLELKMIADVGLLGLPNAGKSTLLAALSRARPRIAAYPFTTLTPYLGVVGDDPADAFVLADLPGLIEGASRGAGLGGRFLRHIERTRIVLHVVDVSGDAPVPPAEAYRIVREEIRAYGPALREKPEIVVANKIDLPGSPSNVRSLSRACGSRVLRVSAREGRGLRNLVRIVRETLSGSGRSRRIEREQQSP